MQTVLAMTDPRRTVCAAGMMAAPAPAALPQLPDQQPAATPPQSPPPAVGRFVTSPGDRVGRAAVATNATASRRQLRLQSVGWALLAALAAGLAAIALALLDADGSGPGNALLPPPAGSNAGATPALLLALLRSPGLDPALRAAGCGFFYGLLAFHLQRVDPDDGHLQAGLVGAICGVRSLSAGAPTTASLAPSLMMECAKAWLPLWLPLIGSALLLHGLQRLLASRRPSLHAPRP